MINSLGREPGDEATLCVQSFRTLTQHQKFLSNDGMCSEVNLPNQEFTCMSPALYKQSKLSYIIINMVLHNRIGQKPAAARNLSYHFIAPLPFSSSL